MIVIPDYLIIDEIRRRKEQSKHPCGVELPLPAYEVPDKDAESARDCPKKNDNAPKKQNGVIIIDLHTYKRLRTPTF